MAERVYCPQCEVEILEKEKIMGDGIELCPGLVCKCDSCGYSFLVEEGTRPEL